MMKETEEMKNDPGLRRVNQTQADQMKKIRQKANRADDVNDYEEEKTR